MKKSLLSKTSLLALSTLCSALFIAPSASAKDPDLAFYPAKDWAISEGGSCTAANEFNNGFIVQLDGGANGVAAMTINFRQDVFDEGKAYKTSLSVPSYSRTAAPSVAKNPQILTINMNGQDHLYQEMRGAGVVDVGIDGNKFRFYMVGFSNAAEAFEMCMASKADGEAKMAAPAASATAPAQDIVVSSIAWNDGNDNNAPVDITKAPSAPTITHKDMGNDKTGLDHIGIPEDSPIEVQRESFQVEADFTAAGNARSQLELENQQLREELQAALEESRQEEMSIKGENWDLERATMMYNESERQVQILGQKLQRARQSCDAETKELEAMLFDPMVTNEKQMAKLADLEAQLAKAQDDLNMQRIRYDERIRILEGQMQTQ